MGFPLGRHVKGCCRTIVFFVVAGKEDACNKWKKKEISHLADDFVDD
jgi:hypothetical protein